MNCTTLGTRLLLMVRLLPATSGNADPMATPFWTICHQTIAGKAMAQALYSAPQTGDSKCLLGKLKRRRPRNGKHATQRHCT